jgi:hypothetical protein
MAAMKRPIMPVAGLRSMKLPTAMSRISPLPDPAR